MTKKSEIERQIEKRETERDKSQIKIGSFPGWGSFFEFIIWHNSLSLAYIHTYTHESDYKRFILPLNKHAVLLMIMLCLWCIS